ncbi:MAG: V-type ATP synthase subunit I [Firmicutes bacterium]|nr:V-type ATP synthase subunit I [Bacillota bacterium]
MAIVKMNKLSLIGLESDKDAMIECLMKMGVVEITNLEQKIAEDQWADLVKRDGAEDEVACFDADITKVKSAIDYLQQYDKRKKGLFEPKKTITYDVYAEMIHNLDKTWEVAEQIGKYDEQLSALRAEENKLSNLTGTLEPWRSLTVPVDITSTQATMVALGVVPVLVDIDGLERELYEQVPESYMEAVNADKDQHYLSVIYYTSYEDKVMQVLKQSGFSRVAFKELQGTIQENITKAENRIKEIEAERSQIEKRIAGLTGEKDQLEILHDHLQVQKDRKKVLGNIAKTEKIFMLEGWLPAKNSEKVEKSMREQWDCVLDISAQDAEEEPPVLLENNAFVKPFELITELYSLPNPKGIDANPFMAPFYFVFFGLMISDAGYGLIMAILTGIIISKYKLQGLAEKLIKLLFLGGISTFIWGALFGGWFGNIVDAVTNGTYTIPPLWFNPLNDPMKLLLWSFIFGGVQLYVGMGIQAYKLIRDGKALDALFDVGFWYIFLTGLVLLFLGGTAATVGQYMALAGAGLLVITQGRSQKGIIKKFMMGILSLYNVTGFLSDVLSYSRLLALGLATGVIATVVNTMGTLFGFNVGGIIILIIVFIGGHAFNILINALGAYVHASRLQYVEFFGKFYEGGGKAFQPFKMNTKYIELKDKEAI